MRVSVFDINHGKQIVLLPSSVRFEGAEAYVRKDPLTGDVVLSHKPESWNDFFEAANATDVPADFMSDGDTPRVTRDPFENWTESGAALKVLGQGTTEPTRRTASQCTGVLVAL